MDLDAVRHLADNLPDSGEPPYSSRVEIRRDVLARGGVPALLRLEELCARNSYAAWQAYFPADDEPMTLLRRALADPSDAELPRALGRLRTALDDAQAGHPDASDAVAAGSACLATAQHAVSGAIQDPDAAAGERELDPYSWTPCYFASLVAASGPVGYPGSDDARRRDYWRWYLLEAVPSVW